MIENLISKHTERNILTTILSIIYGISIVKNAIVFGYNKYITALNVVILKKNLFENYHVFYLVDRNFVG